MKSSLTAVLALAMLALAARSARAHFVFIVPEPGEAKARVILSETLEPDEDVDVGIIRGLTLNIVQSTAETVDVELRDQSDTSYQIELPGRGDRVIFGRVELGVSRRGDSKPHLLVYYPKTILGDPWAETSVLGERSPVELVPVKEGDKFRLRFTAEGKPVAGGEVNLVLPNGDEAKVKTDALGLTEPLAADGRYGAWARHFVPTAGERDGKAYEEVRRYATLVVDPRPTPTSTAAKASPGHAALAELPTTATKVDATRYGATLPVAASSFGAAALGDWLYVYGGHVSRTHKYSTDSVVGRFDRLDLADPQAEWESLPGGPALQGLNIVAYNGKIYRVGGMQPRNPPGSPAENFSVADVAAYDPQSAAWTPLPSLPEPRSSHDLVALNDKLIVVGGWCMKGEEDEAWSTKTLVLDLKAIEKGWQAVDQPFVRRALIAAAFEEKVYVVGGIDPESDVNKTVNIYDPANNSWTVGPELPGNALNGFSPAACVLDGRLYVSVADGTLYRLNESRSAWEKVGVATPRIVHRLIPRGDEILIVGGAMKGENLDLIETIRVAPRRETDNASQ